MPTRTGKEPLPPTRVCFQQVGVAPIGASAVAVLLSARHAHALAELLQILACGEESAALAFEHLARSWRSTAARGALAGIAADELEHQIVLNHLRASLPQPSPDSALQAAMRRFFMHLADRDALVHCLRIAAIDSAVCRLLGGLRRRDSPVASDSTISAILGRIHRDEARHVAIARRCAAPLLGTPRGRDIVAEARDRLARVLAFRATALDALSVDPDRLIAALRTVHEVAEAA